MCLDTHARLSYLKQRKILLFAKWVNITVWDSNNKKDKYPLITHIGDKKKKKKKLKQQNGDHQKLCEREVGHLNQITQHFSSVAEIISSGPLHSLVTKNSTPRPSKLLRDRMIVIAFTTKERIWSGKGFDN